MPKLIFTRHGESVGNVAGFYQGRMDTPLSRRGVLQAERLSLRLRAWPIEAIYSSPLKRALETVRPLAAEKGMEIRVREELIEIDHGEWTGLTVNEVGEHFGELLRLWRTSPEKVKMPGGETLEDVRERGERALREILELHAGSDEFILICSHDAVLRTMIGAAMGLDLSRIWNFRLDNASLTIFDFRGGKPRLLLLNDTCHLQDLLSDADLQAL